MLLPVTRSGRMLAVVELLLLAPPEPREHRDRRLDGPLAREDQGPNWARRMSALGNAVVPRVARRAFVELARTAPSLTALAAGLESESAEFPRSGIVVDAKVYSVPAPSPARTARLPTPRSASVYPTVPSDARSETLATVLVGAAGHLSSLPDPRYVEWMMGFEADWTLVEEREREAPAPPAAPAARRRLNGMHMLMRDRPGTVSATAAIWRALSADERAAYTARARVLEG